jgi:polyphosphate kinase 1
LTTVIDFRSETNWTTKVEDTLDNPSLYINRELSWIRFNKRILEEAHDQCHPLLERIKFLAICGSNLDEFYMTRIARLIKQVNKGSKEKSIDGMTATEQIQATRSEILPLLEQHAECWNKEIKPALANEDINIQRFSDLPDKTKESLRNYFRLGILPKTVLLDEKFDCTSIENLRICLAVTGFKNRSYCIIEIPVRDFGRLIKVPQSAYRQLLNLEQDFVFAEDLVANCLDILFPQENTLTAYPFRLTRNGEIDILMDETSDFMSLVKKGLSRRKTGFPTRLEFDLKTPPEIRQAIAKKFALPEYLIYDFDGPLGLVDLWQLHKINRDDLKDKSFLPSILPLLTPEKNLFKTVAKQDIVLYHPYDGFEVIIDLLREAADDPYVKSIFITMYRMDDKSPIVDALIAAVKSGKRVTAIVELKAKFDEENNIELVNKLRQAGIDTVYNFPNLKIHAKLCLIVRRENGRLVRYSHIGSGNYNSVTAKIYGDLGYLTANQEVGLELDELFNILINGLQEKEFKHLLVAPKTLKTEILKRIDREIKDHRESGRGYLAFKLNNLEDKDIIKALYRASMAGIKIDLNVRALCCLKPGIRGVSENISVISIVGRFLEHARMYYFQNGQESELLIGSSDMMFRNLNERVEVLFSVPDANARDAILEDMLKIHLKDNVKARKLLTNGTYERVTPKKGEPCINSQFWLIQNRGIWHERADYNPKM